MLESILRIWRTAFGQKPKNEPTVFKIEEGCLPILSYDYTDNCVYRLQQLVDSEWDTWDANYTHVQTETRVLKVQSKTQQWFPLVLRITGDSPENVYSQLQNIIALKCAAVREHISNVTLDNLVITHSGESLQEPALDTTDVITYTGYYSMTFFKDASKVIPIRTKKPGGLNFHGDI